MDKVDRARELLKACTEAGITVALRPVLRPAGRVKPEIEATARELADELLEIKLAEEHTVLCARCHRALNSTPAEEVAKVRSTLLMPGTGAAWPPEAVDRLEARLRPGERIVRVDGPGFHVVIERVDGSVYSLGRCDA